MYIDIYTLEDDIMVINKNRAYCYRISHIDNLEYILKNGLCTKLHPKASHSYTSIGNPDIIGTRDEEPVRIHGYGRIGEYVPFYFTPRSIMLFNIVTGHRAPLIPRVSKDKIVILRAKIEKLSTLGQFFFTDGQANASSTRHYNDLHYLNRIDWEIIQQSKFDAPENDRSRPRRYQAEFLVKNYIPIQALDSIIVYNDIVANFVKEFIEDNELNIPVLVSNYCFFD